MQPNDHPLRQWAVDEMHLRRFTPVPARCEIRQAVRLLSKEERGQEDDYLIGDQPAFDTWKLEKRRASGRNKSGLHLLWERHSEASTITLIIPDGHTEEECAPYIRWMEGWCGAVIRATRIFVISEDDNVDPLIKEHGMDAHELVCSDINGSMRVWSDFGIRSDGYGRLLATCGDISDSERGRVVQRMQELGNYRNLALLGLPLVQKYGPQIDALEQALSSHAKKVALAADGEKDDDLLQELIEISSKLEVIRSETGFRLSATSAYASVAADRLETLRVSPVSDLQTLTEFTERRLVPAARTCSVFTERLARIAERISRVMHTLDVRVDTRIKAQNLLLTKSMERSIQLQLRLQSLVEGLSVIAAAYYLVGLIAFIVEGSIAWPNGSQTEIIVAAVTLPAILLIYGFVHRTKGAVLKSTDVDTK